MLHNPSPDFPDDQGNAGLQCAGGCSRAQTLISLTIRGMRALSALADAPQPRNSKHVTSMHIYAGPGSSAREGPQRGQQIYAFIRCPGSPYARHSREVPSTIQIHVKAGGPVRHAARRCQQIYSCIWGLEAPYTRHPGMSTNILMYIRTGAPHDMDPGGVN